MKKKYRVFSLFSGGLDSILSVLWLRKAGCEVLPLCFVSPFFNTKEAEMSAQLNGFKLVKIDITEQLIEVIKKPKYGFGKNLNPCVDCHGLMFREAAKRMKEYDVDFLASGEVLGQRPMSQRKDALNSVANLSEVKDLIVRPLSQKLLRDTLPIREGWLSKFDLLDIQGRGRHRQIALAKELRVNSYSQPAGGCLLTETNFSVRLQDLLDHEATDSQNLYFLKSGRHFRLNENLKLIVGRTRIDNEAMEEQLQDEIVLMTKDILGPLGVLIGKSEVSESELRLAASILLRYNNKVDLESDVLWGRKNKLDSIIRVCKITDEEVEKYRIQ